MVPMYNAGGANDIEKQDSVGSGLSEVSAAGRPELTASQVKKKEKDKEKKKFGRVNIEELVTELRHKYLTILKSCYWEFFEEG